VLLEFRAEVGHVLLRVLQTPRLAGGLDGLVPGIWRHAEDGVRIGHFLRINGRGTAFSTALFLLFFQLPARFFPLPRLQLLPQSSVLFLARPAKAQLLLALDLPLLFRDLGPFLIRRPGTTAPGVPGAGPRA